MKVYQSKSFEKKVKRFSSTEKNALDKKIKKIIKDPSFGEEKKGDLRGIYVHKFKIKTIEYLLSHRMVGNDLELIMIGPHENYYRNLEKYLKAR